MTLKDQLALYDVDGDGFYHPGAGIEPFDCDDTDATVHPGATEIWYDGVDSDCGEDDDYDQDADGQRPRAHGGADCNDEDAAVYAGAAETWFNASQDNDCDGELDEELALLIGDVGVRFDGEPGDALGYQVAVLPSGWFGASGTVVAVSATTRGNNSGGVDFLDGARALDDVNDAKLDALAGTPGQYLSALGFAGQKSAAVLLASVYDDPNGPIVHGWVAPTMGSLPGLIDADFTLSAMSSGGVAWANASLHDLDGDGVAELLVSAVGDDSVSSEGGAVFIFSEPATLLGALDVLDADTVLTSAHAQGRMEVGQAVGDLNGDGRDDLGLSIDATGEAAGGLVLLGGELGAGGEAADLAVASVFGGGMEFSMGVDLDGDGLKELIVTSGDTHQFAGPIEGSLTPWDDAVATSGFRSDDDWATHIQTDEVQWVGRRQLAAASWVWGNEAGVVVLDPLALEYSGEFDTSRFRLLGGNAGDRLGSALAIGDLDADGVLDLIIGASGADYGGVGAGAVYFVRGPR